jgi:hypothetical protein
VLRNKLYAKDLPKVWLAQYIGTTGYPDDYEFWQCSDGGVVPGISGRVDLDFWYAPGTATSDDPDPDPDDDDDADPDSEIDYSQVVLPFTDTNPAAWYYSYVQKAYALNIVKGVTATTFVSGDKCSRGQVVTMLYRAAQEPSVTFSQDFTDVANGLYYSAAVSWCKQNNIIQGYGNGAFGVNDPMSRQDLVTVLYRLTGEPTVSGTLTGFGDVRSISSYAENAMLWGVQTGLLVGDENKMLRPTATISRAEACTLLIRYLENIS